MAATKIQHGGYKCNVRNVTLTTRDPWPMAMGMQRLQNILKDQPSSFVDYVFYPEYSESGMLHFHGTIYYKNTVHYHSFLNEWKRYFGFVDSKETKKESLSWHFYCRKDQHLITTRIKRIAKHKNCAVAPSRSELYFQVSDKSSLKQIDLSIK